MLVAPASSQPHFARRRFLVRVLPVVISIGATDERLKCEILLDLFVLYHAVMIAGVEVVRRCTKVER